MKTELPKKKKSEGLDMFHVLACYTIQMHPSLLHGGKHQKYLIKVKIL